MQDRREKALCREFPRLSVIREFKVFENSLVTFNYIKKKKKKTTHRTVLKYKPLSISLRSQSYAYVITSARLTYIWISNKMQQTLEK